MDDRTARLLGALDPVGVSLLLEMLRGPTTEHALLHAAEIADQSLGNRRLHRLRDALVIAQEAGKPRAPRRLWAIVHPEETDALLNAVFALSEAIDVRDSVRRLEAMRKLKSTRAERLDIRLVGGRSLRRPRTP